MNDDFTDLENELRIMEPLAVSKRLTVRIEAQMNQLSPQRTWTTWWKHLGFNRPLAAIGWGLCSPALTAAAVIAVLHFTDSERLPSPSQIEAADFGSTAPGGSLSHSRSTASAKTTNVLFQALDEGVVLNGGEEPIHRFRFRSADLVEGRNPDTGANWEISYPREDVVLMPVQAQ